MKWTYIIQQKIKVALLLTCIMLLFIVTNLIGRKNISDMNRSFISIYNDRLIPATDIFHLTENLYNKQLLIEKFLLTQEENNLPEVSRRIVLHNKNIDSLIGKIEKTYLVDKESISLKEFKIKAKENTEIEKSVLQLSQNHSKEKAQMLYENEGKGIYESTIRHLYDLIEIQSSVGKELMNESETIVYSSKLLSIIQIVLAIVIGAIIQALVLSSKVVERSSKNFHLN